MTAHKTKTNKQTKCIALCKISFFKYQTENYYISDPLWENQPIAFFFVIVTDIKVFRSLKATCWQVIAVSVFALSSAQKE